MSKQAAINGDFLFFLIVTCCWTTVRHLYVTTVYFVQSQPRPPAVTELMRIRLAIKEQSGFQSQLPCPILKK